MQAQSLQSNFYPTSFLSKSMNMNMRHWAIIGITAITIAAITTKTNMLDLAGIYAIFGSIIAVDKAAAKRA